MKAGPLAQFGFAVVLLSVATVLLLRTCARPHIDLNPYQALGTVAAEEATRLCGGTGRIVLVIPDPGSDRDPVLDAQLAAFKKTLQRQGSVELAAVETVTMDPFLRMQTGGAIPPDRFAAIRQKHATVTALVLFIGFPPMAPPDADEGHSPNGTPKVMVVSAALPGYDALLRAGVLDLAIVSRPLSAEAPASPPATVREAFDREYLILRREGGAPGDGG